MATIAAIRSALAGVLVITGFQTYTFLPASLSGKALVVRRLSTRYGTDFDGSDDSTYAVSIYIPWTDNATAQALLDACLGSTATVYSVKSLIEAAPTLNGVVDFVNVESASEEGLVLVDNITYLAGTVNITVGSTDL